MATLQIKNGVLTKFFAGTPTRQLDGEIVESDFFDGELCLPDGIAVIDKYAFFACRSLKRVVLPKSVKRIEKGAFEDCTALETIAFADGLRQIADRAFCGCVALKEIALPKNVIVGDAVFEGCRQLATLFVGAGSTLQTGAFFGCTNLVDVQVDPLHPQLYAKEGCLVTRSGKLIFGSPDGCVPEGVEIISDGTYTACDFEEIFLPSTLRDLGFEAFEDCNNIRTVHFAGTLQQWQQIDFHEEDYCGLQAYGDHENPDGVPYWYLARSHCRVICLDGETELYKD